MVAGEAFLIKLSPITKLENTVYFLPELLTTSVATLLAFKGLRSVQLLEKPHQKQSQAFTNHKMPSIRYQSK